MDVLSLELQSFSRLFLAPVTCRWNLWPSWIYLSNSKTKTGGGKSSIVNTLDNHQYLFWHVQVRDKSGHMNSSSIRGEVNVHANVHAWQGSLLQYSAKLIDDNVAIILFNTLLWYLNNVDVHCSIMAAIVTSTIDSDPLFRQQQRFVNQCNENISHDCLPGVSIIDQDQYNSDDWPCWFFPSNLALSKSRVKQFSSVQHQEKFS